jgi:hypothetical protein
MNPRDFGEQQERAASSGFDSLEEYRVRKLELAAQILSEEFSEDANDNTNEQDEENDPR